MTLLGVRMSLEAFPSQMAGLLMSCFSLGFVAGSYWLAQFWEQRRDSGPATE